jgi:urease accessory protein
LLTTLLAMQQADAAFPSGAFAFSNGVEGLAALPFPFDRASLRRHAIAAIRYRWAGTDRVALVQAHRAGADLDRLAAIDSAIESATLVAPLRRGSQRAGRSFLASHARIGTTTAEALKAAVADGRMIGHLATIQGSLWRAIDLSEREAAAISGYQTVSGLASAAVRLGRIGAIEAQVVVRDMLPIIEACCAVAIVGDDLDFASFVPFIEIAAMRSASADLRLFAN